MNAKCWQRYLVTVQHKMLSEIRSDYRPSFLSLSLLNQQNKQSTMQLMNQSINESTDQSMNQATKSNDKSFKFHAPNTEVHNYRGLWTHNTNTSKLVVGYRAMNSVTDQSGIQTGNLAVTNSTNKLTTALTWPSVV
jgi:hypothetical protein